MNKKLLLTVLAAGLVFPTAVANANTTSTGVPAEAPTRPEVVLELDGSKSSTPAQNFTGAVKQVATAVPTDAPTRPERVLELDGSITEVATTAAGTAVTSVAATSSVAATTKAPTTTTGNKGPVVKPTTKPAVKSAVAKAKASAKTGAKKLPKTSAVK